MTVQFDPIQRAEQWKRRVDREELAVCYEYLAGSTLSGTEARRFEQAQQALQRAGVIPRSQGAAPRSTRSSAPPSWVSGASSMRSSAHSAGRAIALTPRSGGSSVYSSGRSSGGFTQHPRAQEATLLPATLRLETPSEP
uniref:Uncharacterized protein n=1 Tax=Pyrodinium bahamense TaxID=73915 RepID=A0A7S0B918_9DINO